MKASRLFALAACLLASCSGFHQTALPPRTEPTRIVNDAYSRRNVRYYEVYDLGWQRGFAMRGYKVAFVHMKNGATYPVPCMPSGHGMTPTIGVTVKANPTNDAWRVSTYLCRQDTGAIHLVTAEFVRRQGDLFIRPQLDFDGTTVEFARLNRVSFPTGRRLGRSDFLLLED